MVPLDGEPDFISACLTDGLARCLYRLIRRAGSQIELCIERHGLVVA